MLTFHLKKHWFEKIKSGEKTHEYREVKPYWEKRITSFLNEYCTFDDETDEDSPFLIFEDLICEFVCGYPPRNNKEKRLTAKIKSIGIINGLNTDLKINKPVYDIEFELIKEQK